MFQFTGFPPHDYGFIMRCIRSSYAGFPIQKSADLSVFATPRSLSQLITSFFGSQCQGIRPVPFFCLTSRRCHTLCASLLCRNAGHFCRQTFYQIICFPCTFYGACRSAPSVALTALFLLMSFLSKNTKCFHFSYSLRLILSSRYSVFKVRSAVSYYCYGLKWTRTTDLTLIRRAL